MITKNSIANAMIEHGSLIDKVMGESLAKATEEKSQQFKNEYPDTWNHYAKLIDG